MKSACEHTAPPPPEAKKKKEEKKGTSKASCLPWPIYVRSAQDDRAHIANLGEEGRAARAKIWSQQLPLLKCSHSERCVHKFWSCSQLEGMGLGYFTRPPTAPRMRQCFIKHNARHAIHSSRPAVYLSCSDLAWFSALVRRSVHLT